MMFRRVMRVVVLLFILHAGSAFAQNVLIWDGETPFGTARGVSNNTDSYRAAWCFEGHPNSFGAPKISLSGLPSFRIDLSAHDEIWFFAKTDVPGSVMPFSVGGFPLRSNELSVNPYIDGGILTTSYKLVRIPIADLETVEYPLDNVDGLYFGISPTQDSHSIFIDEVWAIDLSTVDSATSPLIGELRHVVFGNVPTQETSEKVFTVSNIGFAPLDISGISLTGADSENFTVDASLFTVLPGQTHDVAVSFTPTGPGAKEVQAVILHTPTAMGDMFAVPLSGNGDAPLLETSVTSLDLGAVPLGETLSWTFQIDNVGNNALAVSEIVSSNSVFSTSAASVNIAPGGSAEIGVTFTPSALGTVTGGLTLISNDVNNDSVHIDLSGRALSAGTTPFVLPARVDEATSSGADIAWGKIIGVDAVSIFLGTEPSSSGTGALPGEMLWAELSGAVSEFKIENFAAATDVFVRIEASSGSTVVGEGRVHVRTTGGPLAELSTAVREVHLFAPNIIQIVVENKEVHSFSDRNDLHDDGVDEIVGYTGETFQAGPWTVSRADSTPIAVLDVYRNSIPVGQSYYEMGWQAPTNDHLNDVDHLIYLILAEPIDNRSFTQIQGPFSTDFWLPFSDRYLETPVIQVNQVGYSPRSNKRWAYVSGWIGDGGPLSLDTFPTVADVIVDHEDALILRNSTLSSLPITIRAAFDSDAGTEVKQINLAELAPAEGVVYRVRIPGVGVSWPTQVSETAVFKSFYIITRGLYFNRWGRDLQKSWSEWGPRAPDHPTVFTAELSDFRAKFPEDAPRVEERPQSGGHHDAGDFDIRPFHYIVPMLLMRAFELNPTAFTDGQLSIPESGNGIPDFLDEALWNIAGWEDLQEADGGIRLGVESWRHPWGRTFADEDQLVYWTYSREAIHSARIAAAFAQAARLLSSFDIDKSEALEVRARQAYAYAFANGVGTNTGGPALFAASELYRLTGEASYFQMYESVWHAHDNFGRGPGIHGFLPWGGSYGKVTQPFIGDFFLGYLSSQDANRAILAASLGRIAEDADKSWSDVMDNHAHRNGRGADDAPTWGVGTAVGEHVMRIFTRLQLAELTGQKKQSYVDAISLSADYVLGGNPAGMTWITGLGSRHPNDPRHHDSAGFINEGGRAVPGLPVYGPVEVLSNSSTYDYGKNITYPAFASHPMLRRYADINTFIANNEFDVTVQALQAQLFAILLRPGLEPFPALLPFGAEHTNPIAPREAIIPNPAADAGTPMGPEGVSSMRVPWFSKGENVSREDLKARLRASRAKKEAAGVTPPEKLL